MDVKRSFEIAACKQVDVEHLQRELGVSSALAQVLVRRGLGESAAARAFLAGEEQHEPSAFAGIERAIAPILRHVREGGLITIHGDYDVDGICSTAILVRALRALGGNVDWYLPDRQSDGYGLNPDTVRRLAGRGTQLLVTVDCAITAVAEVEEALALGIEVVVTDHHSPRADGALPRAPIVHPLLCGYPCTDLCAAAVAYKLAQGLWQTAGRDPRELEQDLDLVALATVADVVPLVGENRMLVRRGLRALAGTAKPGLRALMAVARVDGAHVNERALGFALAPRLNAAGRLYRADAGLELMLTEDATRAAQIADELDRANRERRQTERTILFEAEAQVAGMGDRAGYVLAGEGWHPGVIGIVASRLVERLHRPVVLIALEGDRGRGSGRSIEDFDLLAALEACAGHLSRFGGHRAAAGLELERAQLPALVDAFAAHARSVLGDGEIVRGERVDAVLDGQELGMALAEELQLLAPFGRGNPTVSLLVRSALLSDRRPMGEGKHLRFTVDCGQSRARAVAFGNEGRLPIGEQEPADATFTLEVNEWNGVSEPRLVLRHVQSAATLQAEAQHAPAPARDIERTSSEEPEFEPMPGQSKQDLVLFALP